MMPRVAYQSAQSHVAKVQKRDTTEKLETVSVMSQQTSIRMELTLIRVMALEKPDHLAWPILHVPTYTKQVTCGLSPPLKLFRQTELPNWFHMSMSANSERGKAS
jgi:hypothetical protein